jgi:kumamolisin
MTKIQLTGSNAIIPSTAISVVATDPDTVIKSTIFVRRNDYNGMTVAQYADTVIAGINKPLDRTQFKAMFGASAQDLADVAAWIGSYGITVTGTYRSSAAVELTGTVGQFNTAFDITLQTVDIGTHVFMSYNGSLSVPSELEGIIEHVNELDQSMCIPNSFLVTSNPPSAGSPAAPIPVPGSTPQVTPQTTANAYNFPGQNNGNDGEGQVVAIILPFGAGSGAGGAGCGYTQQNLNSTFNNIYGLDAPTVISVALNGTTNNPTGPYSAECMLDIAMVGGIVPKATIIVYFCTSYITVLTAILNDTASTGYYPKIISLSAGGIEAPPGQGGTTFDATDVLLAQCAAQGITICVSSGDWGPNNSPVNYYPPGAVTDTACWPSSSPYVLSIGGTTLLTNPDGSRASEVAWNNNQDYYITGGNFSHRYPVPVWQNGLSYKTFPGNTVVTLTAGLLNSTQGRVIPDVSLNADPYCGWAYYYTTEAGVNTEVRYAGGTSASAPLWAGLIARINQVADTNVGVLNATCYANPGNFYDITTGNNYNPQTPGESAFAATVGYDATTGLGSYKQGLIPDVVTISVGTGISIGPGITFS